MLPSDELPQEVEDFMLATKQYASENDIEMKLKFADSVSMGSLKVNGYFCNAERVLAVALGRMSKPKPMTEWLSTFVHESCHMDQYLENSRVWTHTIMGCNPSELIDLWMREVVELKPRVLQQMILGVLNLELDCERRSVKKIKKQKLPIDIEEYTQKANSYVYFYHMVGQRREWYHIGTEPYNVPAVWQAMPKTFANDYTQLPAEYKKLYVEHCFKGKKR